MCPGAPQTIEEDDSEAELPYWKVPSVVLSIIGTSAYAGLYTAWDEVRPGCCASSHLSLPIRPDRAVLVF